MARGKKNCPSCGKENGARIHVCPCGHEFSKSEKINKIKSVRKSNKIVCSSVNISLKNNKLFIEIFGEDSNIEAEQISIDGNNVSNTEDLTEENLSIIEEEIESIQEEVEDLKATIGQGKKLCPECNSIVGARNYVCPSCQFEFVKKEKAIPKESKGLGKGKKLCPSCNIVVGAKTKNCSCGYDFVNKEIKPEVISTESITVSPVNNFSPIVVKQENIIKSIEAIESEYDISNSSNISARGHAERILDKGPEAANFLMFFAKKRNCWPHIDWKHVEEELSNMGAEISETFEY